MFPKKTQTLLEKVCRKICFAFLLTFSQLLIVISPFSILKTLRNPPLSSVAGTLASLLQSSLLPGLTSILGISDNYSSPKGKNHHNALNSKDLSPPTAQPLYSNFIPQSHLTSSLSNLFLPLHLIYSVTNATGKIFHKRPKSKYIRVCRPQFLLTITEFCAYKSKNSHKQHVSEVWLCSKFIYS